MINRRDALMMLAAAGAAPSLLSSTTMAFGQSNLPPDTLRIIIPELPLLTSAFNTNGSTFQIAAKIFDGLVDYDFDFNMKPQLAESWEIAEDWQTITFKLRAGVTWHDGAPFTSADVAWSALNVWKPLHPRGRATFQNLDTVETPDDLTVIFKFAKPAPVAARAFHSVESQILPKHIYEGTDIVNNPANSEPIGTGPFRFVSWERGSHVELEKFPEYWAADRVSIERIIVRTVADASSRSSSFEAQEVDLGGQLPIAVADARRLEQLDYIRIPERGDEFFSKQHWFAFNTRKEVFQDVRVRQAIAYAFDKDAVVRLIWQGFGTKATGPIHKALTAFYNPDVQIYDFNIEKANQLLDEAGYPRGADGVRFRITHDPAPVAETFLRTGDLFKQALRPIGIEVELRSQDYASWIKRIWTDYDYDTTNAGGDNLPDPSMGVQRFYWSKNIVSGVPFSNCSGYTNAEVDQLLEAALIESDQELRQQQFYRFQEIVAEEVPHILLADLQTFSIENARVNGASATPFGMHANMADVTLG